MTTTHPLVDKSREHPDLTPRRQKAVDEAARVRMGASSSTEANVLRDLVGDPSVTVRAALALNPAVPAYTNQALARDADERVRVLLARKLATLVPNLSSEDQAQLHRETWDTLRTLVTDEAVRVRATIAEVVKDMPDAPRELVVCLAQDAVLSVSEPVIRLSPLLTTADLLALVARAPAAGSILAVAHRPRLDAAVSDAIAATVDSAAICALLANASAQIREVTLDALVARSVEHTDWHEPLVRRSSLSPRAAQMLSAIVATHLLEVLATRADLAPPLAEELRHRIAARLVPDPYAAAIQHDMTADEAQVQAHALAQRGQLVEETVLEAARRGEARYATALLAVASGMPVSVVDRAASLRSSKGLVSLAWKAGFTMRTAVAMQSLLARLAPNAVLTAGQDDGFPLALDEMRWQLDFLGRMER